MTGDATALLAASAGVAFGHAILPDHWVPLAVLGRTRRYPLGRVARLASLAGIGHVVTSLLLGAVIVVVGLQFESQVQGAQDAIIGAVLIATGIGFVVLELSGRGHAHEHDHHAHADPHADRAQDHPDDHVHGAGGQPPSAMAPGRGRNLAAVMVPFGAAASPDLTILPVFLAASTAGVATAVGSLTIFATVTIVTIVGLTVLAARSGYEVRGEWLERWGNAITAVVLIVIGGFVFAGLI